ncbi:CAP domain-containing protein [Streptomyces sp. 5-8]|uniref:CAP domain-containing protein n=1 Tax=Streptomyces musisoli TaxID=2802280 RepID=A0ABS1NYZ5_9ACTN|nr:MULTISPECIES: CAP domain-containing protein [Streptomyces]MBL1105335.1 CAP domain-containing protein [Streptomyces musisoli]MBY8844010.1 CAP domain-containing protein [Streptomyces sp. SP2-10]
MGVQADWRYCGKCQGMFFDGYPLKGACPRPVGHKAVGYNFVLPHDVAGTPTAQNAWRYCVKCHGMFYDGYAQKGACPGGGGHQAAGYDFVLPHDVAGTPTAQNAWRYCVKCHGMFYDGYAQKGTCPGGGGHQAAGYDFVLPHQVPTPVVAMDAQELQAFELANQLRQQNGSPPVQVERLLVDAARFHSQDLADHPGQWEVKWNGWPGHVGSDGSTPPDRIIKAVGSPGSENVYVAYYYGNVDPPPPQQAVNWWLTHDQEHRANLLDPAHRTSGIGIAYGAGMTPDGHQGTFFYFTQDFHD